MLTNGLLGYFNLLMPFKYVVKTPKLGIVLEEVGLLLALPTTSLNHAYSYTYMVCFAGVGKRAELSHSLPLQLPK